MSTSSPAPVASPPAAPLRGFARWQNDNASQINDFRRGLFRFMRNGLSVLGLVIVVVMLIVAATGQWWVPFPGDATGDVAMSNRLQAPSSLHFFGTDDAGRDVFTRTVLATRTSFQVGIIILVVAISLGVTLGALAGYYGGVTNTLIMRFTDVMLTFPGIFLPLAVASALGRGMVPAMLALSITWWPGYCRLVEAQILKVREEDFVAGAKAIGANQARVIFRHILPNTLTGIIVKASMDFGFAVLAHPAPRARLGLDDCAGAPFHAQRMVDLHFSGALHVCDGVGLQPAGRRAARSAGSECDGEIILDEQLRADDDEFLDKRTGQISCFRRLSLARGTVNRALVLL
jgi:peptide/nickel transport system permease protein